MPPCILRAGERALVTTQGVVFPDGTVLPSATLCDYEPGSTLYFRFSDGSESPYVGPLPPTREKRMEPVPAPEAQPAPEVQPTLAPAATVAQPAAPAAPAAQTLAGDSDLGIALGAGQILQDNPWAPLVMLALAGVGVLGGRKAWSFYSERAAQNHELALKKLDIEEKQVKHQQPPACLLRDAEHEAKLSTMQQQINALENKVASLDKGLDLGDFDLDEIKRLDKRMKKLERAAKDHDKDED